jgi:putative PIN family toxin of toxin-antitoxin system
MRIVLDTNVLISGVFFGGNPRKILNLWQEKTFELISSPSILNEYEEVLNRLQAKSKKTDLKLVQSTMKLITLESIVINPTHDLHLSRDPDDDKFINCALSGSAFYIVSGDNDLLELEEVEGVQIVTAREFLERMSL